MDNVDASTMLVIAAMAAATYATKAGGLWLLNRLTLDDRLEACLEALPGAIVVSIVGVELVTAGPAAWIAAIVVVLLVARSGSLLLGLVGGVAGILALRALLPL